MDTTITHIQPFPLWKTGTEVSSQDARLTFSFDAPALVEIAFPSHDGSSAAASYTVPRELLTAGLQHTAGKDGITVRPYRMADWLVITLPGLGDFYADAVVLKAFLDATAELVPAQVSA